MSLSSRTPKNVGLWARVDFSEFAKEYSVGYDMNKKIYIMYDTHIIEEHNYSKALILELKNKNIFIDTSRVDGREIPSESQFIPSTNLVAGRLQIIKRM